MSMTYQQVIDSVVRKTRYQTPIVQEVVEAFVETITHNVMVGKNVEIKNFGSFKLKFLGRRTIPRVYATGEEAVIPSHFKVSFKEYKAVTDRVVKMYRDYFKRVAEADEEE